MMADIDDRTRGKRRFPPDDRAITDEDVKVIVLAAKGSASRVDTDLREGNVREALRDRKLAGSWSDRADWEGDEAYHDREKEIYDSFCRRWRELSKPTIAWMQGKAIAGALMLIWPCDPVIASEDATSQDNTLSEFKNELKFSPYISDAMVIGNRSPEMCFPSPIA